MRRQKRFTLLLLLLLGLLLVACSGEEGDELDEDTPIEEVSVPGEGSVFGDADEGVLAQDQEVVDEEDLLESDEPFADAESAMEETEGTDIGDEVEEVETELPMSLATLEASPQGLYDRTVVVEDEVNRIISPTAFTLGEEDTLILSSGTAAFDEGLVVEGGQLRTQGTVREFDRVTFEEEFGVELDEEIFREFEGRPALIVDPETVESIQ
ncbi:MAG: hypothetical protein M3220_01995 [Chloroflexota bacterium]|nr:hypothetical protein [Chloroflexota bacterium]